jgi:predicted alpha/beta-fold hydrolase
MNSGSSSGAKDYSNKKNIVNRIYPIVEKTLPRTAWNWACKQFFTPIKIDFTKKELDFLTTSSASFLDINDKKIAIYEWGKGRTVILQHGWGGKGVQFVEMIKALVTTGFHVVVLDAPAHGNSTGKWTSAFEFMEVIEVLNRKYSTVHSYIGHSMGGLVLLNVLAAGIKLNQVIIINTPTKSDSVMNAFLGIIGGSQETAKYLRSYIERKYNRSFDSLFSPLIPPEYTKDIMVIHDKKDRQVTFDTIAKTKELLPNASFYFTEGLGHTRILYAKDVVEVVVDTVLSKNNN